MLLNLIIIFNFFDSIFAFAYNLHNYMVINYYFVTVILLVISDIDIVFFFIFA